MSGKNNCHERTFFLCQHFCWVKTPSPRRIQNLLKETFYIIIKKVISYKRSSNIPKIVYILRRIFFFYSIHLEQERWHIPESMFLLCLTNLTHFYYLPFLSLSLAILCFVNYIYKKKRKKRDILSE